MRALTVTSPGRVALLERDDVVAGAEEVLLRPALVGVCGTDLDIIDGRIDPTYVRYPVVLGHEWSGVVLEAASELERGMHAVVEGVVPCGRCRQCAAGDTNRCQVYDEFGFVRDGAAADLLVAPPRLVHRLDAQVSAQSAALLEPAAVVLRALTRAEPKPGMRVLVVGDGTVALLVVRLLRLWSPSSVTVLGRRAAQETLAAAAGADAFVTDHRAAGTGFDLVVEAAGAAGAVAAALAAPARGGTVVLLGFPGQAVAVPVVVDDVVNGDLRVMGSFSYTTTAWAAVVDLLNSGRLDLGFLVTHRFDLDDWESAVDALRGNAVTGARGKVLLSVGGAW